MLDNKDLKKLENLLDRKLDEKTASLRHEFKANSDSLRQEFKSDLKANSDSLRQELKSSTDTLRHDFKSELSKELRPIKSDVAAIHREIRTIVNFFDTDYIKLSRRVEKIERNKIYF